MEGFDRMADSVHNARGKHMTGGLFSTTVHRPAGHGATSEGLDRYLALGPRAILIDEISSVDAGGIVCAATVREHSAYVRDHSVSAVAILEYLAQAVGVFVGYHELESGGQTPLGLLVGCSKARLAIDGVQVGARLTLEARQTWGRRAFGTFECVAGNDGREVVAASLTVARPDPAWMEKWKSPLS